MFVCTYGQNCGQNSSGENLPFEDRFVHYYRFGGYATHIQQPAKYCIKIPENIELNKAPPLLCAGLTVFTPMSLYIKKDDNIHISKVLKLY